MNVMRCLCLELPIEDINKSIVIGNTEKKIKYSEAVLLAGIKE